MTTKEEAHEAVRTLLTYLEGPEAVSREGLLDTPKRVIESWDEIFAGYNMNASDLLQATFNAEGYDGIVLLRNIEFTSTCEHHLQPFHQHVYFHSVFVKVLNMVYNYHSNPSEHTIVNHFQSKNLLIYLWIRI